jgi:hypothetical protein
MTSSYRSGKTTQKRVLNFFAEEKRLNHSSQTPVGREVAFYADYEPPTICSIQH